ncbi:hypothetical protein BCON_0133g00240 [Botryotinia convoluta]|uniref:Uncharacterized protein n=1 Tax=Botryotinia convoluta TaxID=54673 RepID=A0A4Z1HUM4_9HELO|nr:hypothetical protein BCON_0133g00240 [Botryotinia convoluta]
MCVYYTDRCPQGHIILVYTTASQDAQRNRVYCPINDQTVHNRCQRKLKSSESCPVCHDLRLPAGEPGEDENDGDGDGGKDDDDDNDDDDSGNGRRKDERTGAVRQASLPAIRAGKHITRKREPDNQEDVSKKAPSAQAEGRQQYPLRPKILNMDSRIKTEKVARYRSSRDEYEEDEEF